MSCQEDVLKIGKKLEGMVASGTADQAAALDMLKTLKKLPLTLDMLQKTRIGMTVNSFRKACTGEEVVGLAKALIKNWKKLLSDGGGSHSQSQSQSLSKSNSKSSLGRSDSVASVSSSKGDDSNDATTKDGPTDAPTTPTTPTSPNSLERQMSFPSKASDTHDAVRLKCRDLLSKALSVPPLPDNCPCPDEVAAAVEDAIFEEFKNTEMKYKNRVRSRMANLKDSKNPSLRENVLRGLIPPDRIACMTAEELASDDLKDLRAKFTKEAIDDHQMSTTSGTRSDLFKCGRCGKRDATYNQVQTRSADEPMTTFVFCNACGNRWKFC